MALLVNIFRKRVVAIRDLSQESFKYSSRNFAAIALANFLMISGFYALLPALANFGRQPDGTGRGAALSVLIWLVMVLLRPVAGYLVDRRGKKTLLVAGCLLNVIAFLLYSKFLVPPVIYLTGVLHGAGMAAFTAAAPALAANLAPVPRRAEVLGVFSNLGLLALSLAPVAGLSYWLNYGINSLLNLVGIMAFATLAVVLLINEPDEESGSPRSLGQILADRHILAPGLIMLTGGVAGGAVAVHFLGLARERGATAGYFFVSFVVAILLARWLGGKLCDRVGRKWVALPGLLLLTGVMLGLIFTITVKHQVVAGVLAGSGFGMAQLALLALVVDVTAPAERGSAIALFNVFLDLGMSGGALVYGYFSLISYNLLFLAAGLTVLAGALWFRNSTVSQTR